MSLFRTDLRTSSSEFSINMYRTVMMILRDMTDEDMTVTHKRFDVAHNAINAAASAAARSKKQLMRGACRLLSEESQVAQCVIHTSAVEQTNKQKPSSMYNEL